MTNFLFYIFGFLSCSLFLLTFYILDYVFKIRRAKKSIKKTVDGCGDINELISNLNQIRTWVANENIFENEVEKND